MDAAACSKGFCCSSCNNSPLRWQPLFSFKELHMLLAFGPLMRQWIKKKLYLRKRQTATKRKS
jgi:hypothetical protein